MNKIVLCSIATFLCTFGLVYPITYRICNKSGGPVKGQLNYYVLLPAVGCVGPSQFDLQNYESTDITTNDRIADIMYEDSLICCVTDIEIGNFSQNVDRADACKDLTFFVVKKDGGLSVQYYRGLIDCKAH